MDKGMANRRENTNESSFGISPTKLLDSFTTKDFSIYRTDNDEANGVAPLFTYQVVVKNIQPQVEIRDLRVIFELKEES